ncbi:MAG: ABC transporter substrate-binding protein [Gammaproteobacteria bacterium]
MPSHNQTKSALRWLLSITLLFGVGQYAAADTPPDALLKDAANKMITELNNQRAELKGNPARVQALVEEILLPSVDVINSAKLVLGKYWRTASKEQKIGFIKEFRTLLLRFYSSALAEYLSTNDELLELEMISFHPVHIEAGREDITVRSTVTPKKGEPVPVNYHMHLTRNGWKVYDVSVEGVSVITTYKTSFANEIRQQGLDSLITSLGERNAKLLANNTGENPFKGKKTP